MWKVRDDASNEAPVRSGDVEMGLLKMCSDADFGLGVRSDCLKCMSFLSELTSQSQTQFHNAGFKKFVNQSV